MDLKIFAHSYSVYFIKRLKKKPLAKLLYFKKVKYTGTNGHME